MRFELSLLLTLLLSSLAAHPVLQARQASSTKSTQTAGTPLPQYAIDYAPYLYFSSEEQWWPTDVASFFTDVLPFVDQRDTGATNVSFTTLASFAEDTYLTSIDDVTTDPSWLYSVQGMPNATTGYSATPITVIAVPKKEQTVDVFYFFFYAFNQGRDVLDLGYFGNHVGDWEHVMVRFYNEQPEYIFLSQHSNGVAYPYSALMTTRGRATVYVAEGDHGHYATPGVHVYSSVLTDTTGGDLGWDPMLNYRAYTLNLTSNTWLFNGDSDSQADSASVPTADVVTLSTQEVEAADSGSWLFYLGNWGDEQYPDDDPRQFCVFGQCRYTGGPSGPYMKNLGRYTVCFNEQECDIQDSIYDLSAKLPFDLAADLNKDQIDLEALFTNITID